MPGVTGKLQNVEDIENILTRTLRDHESADTLLIFLALRSETEIFVKSSNFEYIVIDGPWKLVEWLSV